MKVTDHWALTEETLSETKADPGGIVRRVEDDDGGVRLEVLIGREWQDRTPQFAFLIFDPAAESAERLTAEEAAELERKWPGTHARYAFRQQPEGDNPPRGTPLSAGKGRKSQSRSS